MKENLSSPNFVTEIVPAEDAITHSPSDYGGDVRIAKGDGYIAFADSGGNQKYSGVNHDLVMAGKTAYADPLKEHQKALTDAAHDLSRIHQGIDPRDPKQRNNRSGCTVSLATWDNKENVAYVTFEGDSPIVIMEYTKDKRVIPHLLNPDFHNPDPTNTSAIFHRLGGEDGVDSVDIDLPNSKLIDLNNVKIDLPSNKDNPFYFQTKRDFKAEVQAGSRLFMLASSDGLLELPTPRAGEEEQRIHNAFLSEGTSDDSEEAQKLRAEAIELFARDRAAGHKIESYNPRNNGELIKQVCFQYLTEKYQQENKGEVDEKSFKDAKDILLQDENKLNSYVSKLAILKNKKKNDKSISEALNVYADIFKNHLDSGGDLSNHRLAIKVNDSATKNHANYSVNKTAPGLRSIDEQESYKKNPTSKDNTTFSIIELDNKRQITSIIMDGNGSFGDCATRIAKQRFKKDFKNNLDFSGLEKPHSAEPAYKELLKHNYTEKNQNYELQDQKLEEREKNREEYINSYSKGKEKSIIEHFPSEDQFNNKQHYSNKKEPTAPSKKIIF